MNGGLKRAMLWKNPRIAIAGMGNYKDKQERANDDCGQVCEDRNLSSKHRAKSNAPGMNQLCNVEIPGW